jgi:DNA polymerase-1
LQAFPNPKRAHSLLKEVGIDTNVRSLFTASSGGVLVSADYSQIEMRVLAHMCGDKGMTELFNCTSGDIYETLARIILNKKV